MTTRLSCSAPQACPLLLLAALLLAYRPADADQGVLFVHVTDANNQSIAGIRIGKGSTTATDRHGKAHIRLAPEVRENQEIELHVTGTTAWAFISPWEGRVRVPLFASAEALHIVIAPLGDQILLKSAAGRNAAIKSILKGIAEHTTNEGITDEQRRRVLAEQAAAYGLKAERVDKAIREYSTKSPDLEEQGLAALYERNYPLATRTWTSELEHREQALKKDTERVAEAAFFLGESLEGEGRYHQAVEALQRAASLRPNNREVLTRLGWALLDDGQLTEARKTFEQGLAAASPG